jgi:hypothetical protein
MKWWGVLGAAILVCGLFFLVRDVERWNAVWYVPAWYGYLLIVDALIFRLRGRSFVGGRLRELAAMMLWSVPFWFLFEAYNLRLQNWYYVFALRSDAAGLVFGFVSFATVLPACFFHAELLGALGAFRHLRCPPLRVGPGVLGLCAALGVVCLVAPLVWPRQAFWLVWGVTLWVPEVINHRAGAPSLLSDLSAGRCGRLARLAAGGLCAGLVWETFNYWARCKWIYTVPGFEAFKLLEMPLLGFGGFPILALQAFSFYALVSWFLRGGRHWEEAEPRPGRPVARGVYAAACGTALALALLTHAAALRRTVASRRPVLAELQGIDRTAVARLRSAGIPTPERLHRAVLRHGMASVAERSGLAPWRIERAFRQATLSIHKGMGAQAALLLESAGVGSVRELSRRDPLELARILQGLALGSGIGAPRNAEVRVWVEAARISGEPRR